MQLFNKLFLHNAFSYETDVVKMKDCIRCFFGMLETVRRIVLTWLFGLLSRCAFCHKKHFLFEISYGFKLFLLGNVLLKTCFMLFSSQKSTEEVSKS